MFLQPPRLPPPASSDGLMESGHAWAHAAPDAVCGHVPGAEAEDAPAALARGTQKWYRCANLFEGRNRQIYRRKSNLEG